MSYQCQTPVAFFIFNRPETTAAVFDQIAAARPKRLLLVADGPRPDRPGEAEDCATARAIAQHVDWPCEVLAQFSEPNLGCRRRMSTGLDWVFAHVPEAIILEDDCLPHPTFFRFMDEMLDRFLADTRVMMVAGSNPAAPWKADRQSYHFSYGTAIWGWATWQRAWRHYDVAMSAWADPESRLRMRDTLGLPELFERRVSSYEQTFQGKIDTWDFQWNFARFIQSGLSVVPAVNLISNIGFGPGATHTHKATHRLAAMPTSPMEFPLKHNPWVAVDRDYEIAFIRAQ